MKSWQHALVVGKGEHISWRIGLFLFIYLQKLAGAADYFDCNYITRNKHACVHRHTHKHTHTHNGHPQFERLAIVSPGNT